MPAMNVETDELDVGQLSSDERAELNEARKLAITCMVLAIKENPEVARGMTQNDRDRMKRAVMTAPLDVLYKRIEAVSIQNPGVLKDAFEKCGYTITPDGMGGYGINPYVDPQSLAGDFIDYDEFIAEIENNGPLH